MKKFVLAAALLMGTSLAANATIVSGTYNITSTSNPTITNILTNPFSFDLTVGVSQNLGSFAKIYQNSDGSSTITAAFSFTDPTVVNSNALAGDVFTTPGNSAHDALTWQNSGLMVVNFSNGAVLNVTLTNASYDGNFSSYQGLTPTISFLLVSGPTASSPTQNLAAVPEPLTLSLFGAGLAGAVAMRRRKKA